MRYLPVFLDLQSGKVLLVGAGELVRAKLRLLVSAGARVRWFATDGDHDLAGSTPTDAARIEPAQGDPLTADLAASLRSSAPAPATSALRCRRGRRRSACPSM